MFNRSNGVLMHISSLPGKYGIGSLGREAFRFVDLLEKLGCGAWQVLPLGPCDAYNSPYANYSAYAGNPFLIDLELLAERGLLTAEELRSHECPDAYEADFDFVRKTRMALLRRAFDRSQNAHAEVDGFLSKTPWLFDYALFAALKEEGGDKPWWEWDEAIRRRETAAMTAAVRAHADDIMFHTFVQREFDRQWRALKAYANKKGIGIIGDMPIYLAADSADVWSNPKLFTLDEDMCVKECAGVPPDYFAADGQKWGNPLYDWDAMRADGYDWWIARLSHALTLYDAVRIDHFRAFSAYWSIPVDKKATEGAWRKGPGMELFRALAARHPNAAIIAEDLGDIDDDVVQLVKDTGFPGMGVMQFAFISDEDNPHLPHNYSRKTIGYTGTHDNNTLLGWLWESSEGSRRYALDYCGFSGDWGVGGPKAPAIRALIRTLLRSSAIVSIVPIQDLCGFGGDTKMNRPGVAKGNWAFRATWEQLETIDVAAYRGMAELYRRTNPLLATE